MFTNLHHNLNEYGSLPGNRHSEDGPLVTRTFSAKRNLWDTVRRNLSISVKVIAAAVGGSRNFHRFLHREGTHNIFIEY
ncbi:hypothetical protein TNCV_206021 [Trichonephila clavipes]|nr:hypothetical protein TNCV_206021 [Trichonephila clavipes]